ncbi:MAG: patatin-like phospholipase family protein [Exilispira sp.]
MQKIDKNIQIHFVLSGGAAKGFAHIGAIKALEEIGIKPSTITGTSAGALFGAVYAMYGNYKDCKNKIDQFMNSEVYKDFADKYFNIEIGSKKEDSKESIFSFFRKKENFKDKFLKVSSALGEKFTNVLKNTKAIFNLFDDESLIACEDIQKVYSEIFGDKRIEDLKIPFVAISSDINSKSVYAFKSGPIVTAVAASTAIPFIFPSIRIEDKILYDGGIVSNLPANESLEIFGEGIRIGIDVTSPPEKLDDDANFIEIIQQIISTSIWSKQLADRKFCDIVITPLSEKINWFAFESKDELIKNGYEYVIKNKEIINSKIIEVSKNIASKKSLFSFFRL